MAEKKEKQYRFGFVLSGGGTRGFAHLGALQALQEEGIRPDVISGASAGALSGVFIADGYQPKEILHFFEDKGLFKFIELSLPRKGLLKMTGMVRLVKKNIKAKRFEDLKIPLYTVATNMNEGRTVYFSEGELHRAVIASAAIPILFDPVRIDGQLYVDGGVMNNFPVEPLIGKCEYLFGININPIENVDNIKNIFHVAERAFHLSNVPKIYLKSQYFDFLLSPPGLMKFGLNDVKKASKIFDHGYKAAQKEIAKSQKRKDAFWDLV